ncbi:activated protein kinase catalytic subunit alpha-1 [Seminavis robusta]|uniref:mitogen-activated protein kinase kinase n=1 Tax=Seminavis robusta TaxID=568900 RepID=A0A9N8HAK6_9STRA|nr:activated protein kinase catalytic subunit alpha-1 [Seminavis robusta]|eukprot:Sro151_g069320.1 activated protein kinase catalytic subunit alpha-1 (346) ;mRNA; r:98312-99349
MRMRKPLSILPLEIVEQNPVDEDDNDFSWGNSTYRQEGLTIGKDYLRFEGNTIIRGKLDPESLSLGATIGRGAFSRVQRAVWKCKDVNSKSSSMVVAVKQYLLCATQQKRQMLIQELRSLCKVECDGLVKLQGAFLEKDTVTMVLEFMDQGSLDNVISKRDTLFTPPTVAGVAFQLLHGLDHLHKHRILHRDVKSENCLLNSKGEAKLCDFGIAALMGDQSMNKTVVGTTKFMAPERLRAQKYGTSSDMWSFGLVLCHMITGEKPWDDVNSIVDLLVTVEETDPAVPIESTHEIEDGLREILASCMRLESEKRMPARILLHSPWFSVMHAIASFQEAVDVVVKVL